jgi:hypothetical protein
MQYWTVEEINRHALADHEAETEIAPGVVIHRRSILKFGLAGAATLLGGKTLLAGTDTFKALAANWQEDQNNNAIQSANDLTVAELVSQLHPQARDLIAAGDPNEAAYVAAIEKLLARIKLDDPWVMRDTGNQWSMETMCWMPPIVLFRIRMEPGSSMNLHDHRHYNGVILCTEGEVRCRNFEYVQPDGKPLDIAAGEVPPSGEDFLIRQTRDDRLKPRQFSTLTRDRDNLHTLVAGEDGCELVDFFTHFRPEARSYDLDWDEKPVDEEKRLYLASWKANE